MRLLSLRAEARGRACMNATSPPHPPFIPHFSSTHPIPSHPTPAQATHAFPQAHPQHPATTMPPKKQEEAKAEVRFGRVRSNLKMGLVGLPNVGKSSLFNLLCQAGADAANYPFW